MEKNKLIILRIETNLNTKKLYKNQKKFYKLSKKNKIKIIIIFYINYVLIF